MLKDKWLPRKTRNSILLADVQENQEAKNDTIKNDNSWGLTVLFNSTKKFLAYLLLSLTYARCMEAEKEMFISSLYISQPASQPASQPSIQAANRPVSQPVIQAAIQPAGRSVSHPVSLPASQSAGEVEAVFQSSNFQNIVIK